MCDSPHQGRSPPKEYVIYLEPDVLIRKHHAIEPKHDAGGIYDDFNPHMGPQTIKYLEQMGRERNPKFNISWIHFGLSGGSYYRAEAVLDAFAPKHVKRIDFAAMEKKEGDGHGTPSDPQGCSFHVQTQQVLNKSLGISLLETALVRWFGLISGVTSL